MRHADRFLTEAQTMIHHAQVFGRLARLRARQLPPLVSVLDDPAFKQFSAGALGTSVLALLGCL